MDIRLVHHRATNGIERRKAMAHLKRMHDPGDSLTQYLHTYVCGNVRSCKETVQEEDQSNACSSRLLMGKDSRVCMSGCFLIVLRVVRLYPGVSVTSNIVSCDTRVKFFAEHRCMSYIPKVMCGSRRESDRSGFKRSGGQPTGSTDGLVGWMNIDNSELKHTEAGRKCRSCMDGRTVNNRWLDVERLNCGMALREDGSWKGLRRDYLSRVTYHAIQKRGAFN